MVPFKFSIFLELFIFLIIFSNISSSNVKLSDYVYPAPGISDDDIIRVAIMGTNDIHGEIFPNIFQSPENTTLASGGATNIYSYVKH